MSKKETLGFCLTINHNHYFFPFAKIENKKSGEQYLIPNNPHGNHFSFHKSGQIHFKDLENNIKIPIKRSDIMNPIIKSADNVKDTFQSIQEYKNDPDMQKALLFILKFLDCIHFGCEYMDCMNKEGISFNIDSLIQLLIDYSNEEGKSAIYEDEEDNENDEYYNDEESTFYKIFNEYLPELSDIKCKYCASRPLIHRTHRKYKMRTCEYCGGYGIDFHKLNDYQVH